MITNNNILCFRQKPNIFPTKNLLKLSSLWYNDFLWMLVFLTYLLKVEGPSISKYTGIIAGLPKFLQNYLNLYNAVSLLLNKAHFLDKNYFCFDMEIWNHSTIQKLLPRHIILALAWGHCYNLFNTVATIWGHYLARPHKQVIIYWPAVAVTHCYRGNSASISKAGE